MDTTTDELFKCIKELSTKDNNDLAKVIVKSCTKIELKKLENELEKSKSCNNMWSQIAKYIAIVIITCILVYNKDTFVDIIQASKTSTTITATLDCNKTIESNCTNLAIYNNIQTCRDKAIPTTKQDTATNKTTPDCNNTQTQKLSDVK